MGRAFIFDMDGTLFQTDKILEIALQETFEYLSRLSLWEGRTPLDKYREIMGVPLPVVWETLLPTHTNEVRNHANEFFHEQLITSIDSGKGALYPHVEEIFHYIKSNDVQIFIASNGQVEYLDAIVKFYQLDNWITEIFSIQQIQSGNKTDLIQEVIRKYDINKGAVIGDRLSDINAAKQNGLLAIGCNFDFAQEAEMDQADVVITSLLEIKKYINY